MSGWKIALLVVGIILLVGALVLMAGGGGLMWLTKTLGNGSTLFADATTSLKKEDAYAIVSEPFEVDWSDESQAERWGLGDFITVKVENEAEDPSRGVFIGIAREAEVGDYLSDVRYYETTQWSGDPFGDSEVQYELHSGNLAPSAPTAEEFWEASAHGTGKQVLEWRPETGKWVLVFMNEDGSRGINVSGRLGAEIPWLFWLGLALLLSGVVALVGGAVMIYFAARSPKKSIAQAVSMPRTGQMP